MVVFVASPRCAPTEQEVYTSCVHHAFATLSLPQDAQNKMTALIKNDGYIMQQKSMHLESVSEELVLVWGLLAKKTH